MKHLAEPKISISRLIPTVSIIAGIIIYGAFQLTNGNHINRRSEDMTMAAYRFAGGIASLDTMLVLDKLSAKQIIEAISKYYYIPIIYRGKKLAKQDSCFAGTVNLDDDIKNVITVLSRLNIYVTYDGKKIIAGE